MKDQLLFKYNELSIQGNIKVSNSMLVKCFVGSLHCIWPLGLVKHTENFVYCQKYMQHHEDHLVKCLKVGHFESFPLVQEELCAMRNNPTTVYIYT